MLILDIFAAFFASTLAALGVGGGALLIVYLTIVLNMEQTAAQGINLLFFIVSSLFALPFHVIKKRINIPIAIIFSSVGILGAWIGCLLSAKISPSIVRFVFGLMLTVAGGITLYKTLHFYYLKFRKKHINSSSKMT